LNVLPGAGCSTVKKTDQNRAFHEARTSFQVLFEPDMEAFYVDGNVEKYLVWRVSGLNNGVCPGEHLHQVDNNETQSWKYARRSKSFRLASTLSPANALTIHKATIASTYCWVNETEFGTLC
jgi:hypothetical protein